MRICSISSLSNLRFLHPLTNFQRSPRLFCWRFPKSHSRPCSSKLVTSTPCPVTNEVIVWLMKLLGVNLLPKFSKKQMRKGFVTMSDWTEVLKQLSSMGRRLVVFPGDGAVQRSTNLYF